MGTDRKRNLGHAASSLLPRERPELVHGDWVRPDVRVRRAVNHQEWCVLCLFIKARQSVT